MIDVGCSYRKTVSMLIQKINDPLNIEVLVSEDISLHHACYFCERKIPSGDIMFELKYRYIDSTRGFCEARYFVDKDCMGRARGKNK
ncbi:MAG: hypothetical protein V1888_00925 [archaeon]